MSNFKLLVRLQAPFFALLLISLPSSAQEPVVCQFGKNGKFVSENEYRIYLLHKTSDKHKYFDRNCNDTFDAAANAAYEAWLLKNIEPDLRDYRRLARVGVAMDVPDPKTDGIKPKAKPDGWSTGFILRDSFADIAVFTKPKDVKAAGGASFGWTRDGIADNHAWSAKGIAGYTVVWQNFDPPSKTSPYLAGFAFAPTVAFNRLSNSNPSLAKKNISVLAFGGSAEVALGKLLDDTTLHFFRTRGALVGDFDGNEKSWSATFEYQPVTNFVDPTIPNLGSPNGLFGLPATYQIDAILRAQYARRLGIVTDPLFVGRDDIFRTGPVVALSVLPQQGDDSPVPEVLRRFSVTGAYGVLYDTEFRKSYTNFTAALGFALDKDGNWAIKLSHETGKVEETGERIDVTKLGLAAKF